MGLILGQCQWSSVVAHMLMRKPCKVEWAKRSGNAFGKRSHSDFSSFPDYSEDLQWSYVDVGCCGLASFSTVACLSLWVSYFYHFVSEASGIVCLFLLAILNKYATSMVISFLQIPAQAFRLSKQKIVLSPLKSTKSPKQYRASNPQADPKCRKAELLISGD